MTLQKNGGDGSDYGGFMEVTCGLAAKYRNRSDFSLDE